MSCIEDFVYGHGGMMTTDTTISMTGFLWHEKVISWCWSKRGLCSAHGRKYFFWNLGVTKKNRCLQSKIKQFLYWRSINVKDTTAKMLITKGNWHSEFVKFCLYAWVSFCLSVLVYTQSCFYLMNTNLLPTDVILYW